MSCGPHQAGEAPSRRRQLLRGIAALALLGALQSTVFACGACIEDKVAATYDHAIAMRARAEHRSVVYGAIEGPVDVGEVAARIGREAARIRGIRRATVRVSAEAAAFSFVIDAAARLPETTVAELRRRVNIPGLRLTVVRVVPWREIAAGPFHVRPIERGT